MISIVMAYYNRRPQLLATLQSICRSQKKKEVEVIIVDDCSFEEHSIDDIQSLFDLDIKVFKIKKEERWWLNPCVPFNFGFSKSKGDTVIIQNPECIHVGDILSHITNNLKKNTYLSYSCYAINEQITKSILSFDYKANDFFDKIQKAINPIRNEKIAFYGGVGWYNHPRFRPIAFHFLSAITREDLRDLNGFDERYAKGLAYDDDEFITRIKKKGMQVSLIERPCVIHQWHYSEGFFKFGKEKTDELWARNQNLLNNYTCTETSWNANPGKNNIP